MGSQKSFQSGEIIIRQGDTGDTAYIVEQGSVEIIIQKADGTEQIVGKRGQGAMIGEMSMVDKAPRTATIRAVEPCQLLEITADDFHRRLNNADPVIRMTTQVILTRYRDMLARAEISGVSKTWPPPEALEISFVQESKAYDAIKLANDFQSALDSRDICLHYQPIIDLTTDDIAGFEALMRWEHKDKGFISPGIFIPIIEESGLIVTASRWTLREALMALKRIEHKTGIRKELFMSVNFSSHDFASEDFVDSVYTTISASDVLPQQVHLEITERLLMGQPDNARETLNMCRKAGMGISIDDFGTGYSSLSYLHHFPIDTLKIDQSFIREMTSNDSSMALVKSIIAMGKNMNMKIIAEGVEHAAEGKILRDLECDLCQGYYFAKPMSERDVTELAAGWTKKAL
jgi:EAL domain-containing protein (putative c-di-GMP-specific phosphodiesterase class I)